MGFVGERKMLEGKRLSKEARGFVGEGRGVVGEGKGTGLVQYRKKRDFRGVFQGYARGFPRK